MANKNELLKELTEANGIAAHEKDIKKIMVREFLKVVDKEDILYDGLGSVACKLGTNGPKIALSGHMDEIGMIITKITDDGFLKFQTIGGWWNQVMLAQQYTITTSQGKQIVAVMGSKPPHILSIEERKVPTEIDQMYMDIGVSSRQEVLDLGIKVGDMITPKIEFQVMANPDFLLAKAWDNRIGCAIVIDVLKELKSCNHPNIYYGMATVQEEVGVRGAKTMANLINPDISIAIDVSIAKDVPGTDGSVKMGSGPDILLYDSGLVGHVELRNFFLEVAKENNIPIQLDFLKGGSTDAAAMHIAHAGSPAMSLCIPTRYIHSHTSMISRKDYENCVKLLVEALKKLDEEAVKKITYL